MDFGEARRAATISGPAGPQEGMGEAIAERLKVLIADDNARIRAGLAEILDRDKSVELVGQAEDGEVAVQMARELRPDIVLMDLHMPRRNGLQATHQLRQELPEVRVLMLTVSDKEPNLLEAMRAGARGYLLKNEAPGRIVEAVQYVAHGGTVVSTTMAAKLASAPKEREPRVDEPPRSKPPGSGLLYAKHVVEMFRGAFVAAAVIGVVFAVNWCVVKRKRATEETKQLELISERNLPVPDDIIENR